MNIFTKQRQKYCLVAFLMFFAGVVQATNYAELNQYYNQLERQYVDENLRMLNKDSLGDSYNVSDGSVTFSNTDISIPGNNDLEVALKRKFAPRSYGNDRHYELGDWQLDIPHIRFKLFYRENHAYSEYGGTNWGGRGSCTGHFLNYNDGIEDGVRFYPWQVWQGEKLYVPGKINEMMLLNNNNSLFKDDSSIVKATKSNWIVKCQATSGDWDNYIVWSPEGIKYTFSERRIWASNHVLLAYNNSVGDSVGLPSQYILLLVSQVEDRFGNKVNYNYDESTGNLLSISSNDGRKIDLNYNSDGRLKEAIANGKRWEYDYKRHEDESYNYDSPYFELSRVTRPDGLFWSYNMFGSGNIQDYRGVTTQTCSEDVSFIDQVEITHPNGMKGTFELGSTCFWRGFIPRYQTSVYPKLKGGINKLVLTKKTLNGPGINEMTWGYKYEGVATSETSPNGSIKKSYINNNFTAVYEGSPMWIEYYGTDGTTLLKKVTYGYAEGNYLGSSRMDFTTHNNYYGETFLMDNIKRHENQLLTIRITTELYDDYGNVDTYTKEFLDYTDYGTARKIKEYNSFSDDVRYTIIDRYTDKTHWLIDAFSSKSISSTDSNYKEVERVNYWSPTSSYKSLPRYHYAYGRWYKENSEYFTSGNQAGLLKKLRLNTTNSWVEYANYHRGIPQTIKTPKSDSTSAKYAYIVVDDNGWVEKQTDFEGDCINYDYDNMGRVSNITYCDTQWSPTVINYSTTTNSEGLNHVESGMFKQKLQQGSYEKSIYYDALLRPKLTVEKDSNTGTRIYLRKEYDFDNKLIFTSRPAGSSVTDNGQWSYFDGLARKIRVSDTELSTDVTYQYISDNKLKVQDALGNITTTAFRAFGEPVFDEAIQIDTPENTTEINFNIFGNVTSIDQEGFSEYRVYDGYQNLCKTVRKDVGNSAFNYDALGRLSWTASGTSISGDTTSCDFQVDNLRKTQYAYNYIGKVKSVTYGDGTPTLFYNYDLNGNALKIYDQNITRDFGYNSRSLLISEEIQIDNKIFNVNYSYNSQGHRNSITYPNGDIIEYSLNAFGNPVGVNRSVASANGAFTYLSNAVYHANGMASSFSYGNGIAHSTSYNDRHLPQLVQDGGVSQLSYGYDANSNITSIVDVFQPEYNLQNFKYDGLDRLTGITGGSRIGTISLSYDGLGNITKYNTLNSNLSYVYDGNNRLTNVNGSGSASKSYSFAYDDVGNVVSNGHSTFAYNLAQQMKTADGKSYLYDGFNFRVREQESSGSKYYFYSKSGQLLYSESSSGSVNHIYFGSRLIAKDGNIESNAGRQHSLPYGKSIEGEIDSVGYTGHKYDSSSGLVYMQARYYDPVIGRFYSNDPVDAAKFIALGNVQGFNRYAYANNNPYKYKDPSGENPVCVTPLTALACVGIAGAGYGVYKWGEKVDDLGNSKLKEMEQDRIAQEEYINCVRSGGRDCGGIGSSQEELAKLRRNTLADAAEAAEAGCIVGTTCGGSIPGSTEENAVNGLAALWQWITGGGDEDNDNESKEPPPPPKESCASSGCI